MRNSQSLEGITEVQGVESLELFRRLSRSLQQLTLGSGFNNSLEHVNLPNCRKSLTFGPFGFDFNCSLEGINFALWNIYCNFWEGNIKVMKFPGRT
jgi:hypothetical protein